MYDEQTPDDTYEQALETLGNMSKVVDALYVKANKISAPPEDEKSKEGKDEKKDEKDKEGEKKAKKEEKKK